MQSEFKSYGSNVGKAGTHQSMEAPHNPYAFEAILDRLESGKNGCVNAEEHTKPYVEIPGWSI